MNSSPLLPHRRDLLRYGIGSLAALGTSLSSLRAEESGKPGLGLVLYCCRFQREALRKQNPKHDLYEPLTFLNYCRQVGAGGMQASLGVRDPDYITKLREQAERAGLFIEAIVSVPRSKAAVERFRAEMRTAKDAGAQAARTVIMPGRRYEQFKTLAEVQEAIARGKAALARAAPIAEKYRLPLAVENHKDQRTDERIALFKQIGSEYVGACLDTGNTFALLEDPIETVRQLAPWTFSVHLKDQAVREYPEGFLLGDIPLGQGCFDLKKMVTIIREAKPKMRFTLELITRDALKVPCLTEHYWQILPDATGADLARTLRIVRAHAAKELTEVSSLSFEKQVAMEKANVNASLTYAKEHLGL